VPCDLSALKSAVLATADYRSNSGLTAKVSQLVGEVPGLRLFVQHTVFDGWTSCLSVWSEAQSSRIWSRTWCYRSWNRYDAASKGYVRIRGSQALITRRGRSLNIKI
jgi:hypothetical protein